jgi:16S rRNA processing protein RimM
MEAAYLAVARFRKPHGLKGEALCWVLTDEPEQVFVVGQELTPMDDDGNKVGEPLVIEQQRRYHRNRLVKFEGIDDRAALELWDQVLLGVPTEMLTPPSADELYEHEVPGVKVLAHGELVGVASGLLETAGGSLLAVEIDGREVLVPFRKPIVVSVDRVARIIEIDPPQGLLEL